MHFGKYNRTFLEKPVSCSLHIEIYFNGGQVCIIWYKIAVNLQWQSILGIGMYFIKNSHIHH